MSFAVLIESLDFNRQKTLAFIDGLAKVGDEIGRASCRERV